MIGGWTLGLIPETINFRFHLLSLVVVYSLQCVHSCGVRLTGLVMLQHVMSNSEEVSEGD